MAERIPIDSIGEFFSDEIFSDQELYAIESADSVDGSQEFAVAIDEALEIAAAANAELLRKTADVWSNSIDLDAAKGCVPRTSCEDFWKRTA